MFAHGRQKRWRSDQYFNLVLNCGVEVDIDLSEVIRSQLGNYLCQRVWPAGLLQTEIDEVFVCADFSNSGYFFEELWRDNLFEELNRHSLDAGR